MALDKNRVVSISAESKIGDQVAARLSSSVSSSQTVDTGYSQQIVDTELYNANKVEVRADIAEFRELVYALEDEMLEMVTPVP